VTDDVRNLDDTATQRLPRPVTPAWPGPLDQTRSAAETPPVPETDVLSIDELMEPAPETVAAETETLAPVEFEPAPTVLEPAPVAAAPAAPEPTPVAAPAPAPAAAPPAPRAHPTGDVVRRLRQDGGAALEGARQHTATWLRAADHGLMVATAMVALLLLIVVAVSA
jgi:hypothetical protein